MTRWLPGILLVLALLGAAKEGPDPRSEYGTRAAKLGKGTPKAWLALADFCEEKLLWAQREEALRKALALDPGHVEAHARLDEVRAGETWLPAAEAEALEAAAQEAKGLAFYAGRWVPGKEAEALREADSRKVGWPVRVRVDTPSVTLYSGRPLGLTLQVAALLENEGSLYQRIHGKIWKLRKDARVTAYLFPDRETYLAARGRVVPTSPTSPCGIYGGGILYVGEPAEALPEGEIRDAVVCSAAHEMLHALDDQMAGKQHAGPIWASEGRADCFGYAAEGRRVVPGRVRALSASRLSDYWPSEVPLSALVGMDRDAFHRDMTRHYLLAWSFVHFLWHGEEGTHAEGFRAYLSGLPQKASRQHLEAALGRSLADLEAPWRRHVETVFLKRGADPGRSEGP